MRTFTTKVYDKPRHRWLVYPELDLEKTVSLLRTMKERNKRTHTTTTANGFIETVTLEELEQMQA